MKSTQRLSDLKAMTPDQLQDELLALKKEQFNLRFQRATGQLENTARVREVRQDIARVRTLHAAEARRSEGLRRYWDAEARFAGRRRQRQAGQDRRGQGRASLHASGHEEDGAPVEELPRPRRGERGQDRRHGLDRGVAARSRS